MKASIIPIFFTVDENYAPWLDCAMRSLTQNASEDYRYHIHVLNQDLTEQDIERIRSAVRPPFDISFTHMDESYAGLTDRKENRLRCDYFTMTIFFRIFIADMFPEYDKGIYLDSDIVVPGDISEMFQLNLGENIIGACPDYSIMGIPELVRYTEQAVGVKSAEYINSGVLLMNLKKMREVDFSGHFLRLLNKYHFDCIAPDQDYFNAMCRGKVLFLDERWDTMPPEAGERGRVGSPGLIHYNLFQKPWCYDNIPYEEYFWKYASVSPYYEDILTFKKNYSEEQKASDRECLRTLVEKGGALDRQDVTFRKVRERGESFL